MIPHSYPELIAELSLSKKRLHGKFTQDCDRWTSLSLDCKPGDSRFRNRVLRPQRSFSWFSLSVWPVKYFSHSPFKAKHGSPVGNIPPPPSFKKNSSLPSQVPAYFVEQFSEYWSILSYACDLSSLLIARARCLPWSNLTTWNNCLTWKPHNRLLYEPWKISGGCRRDLENLNQCNHQPSPLSSKVVSGLNYTHLIIFSCEKLSVCFSISWLCFPWTQKNQNRCNGFHI